MNAKRTIAALSLALLIPLSGGCLFSPPEKPSEPGGPVDYFPYDSPDNLIKNFVLAWEAMDAAEYRDHILYNSDNENATDGEPYATFVFYYAAGNDIWGEPLPDYQTYEEEVANVQRMFSGNPGVGPQGQEVPGIESIDLTLIKNQTWSPPTDPDDVEGDPYPEGTQRVIYESNMLITLKGTIPDTDITGFTVDDLLEFHVIPVTANEGTAEERQEWRLWKWRDLFQEG
jgi:hypothetical protein